MTVAQQKRWTVLLRACMRLVNKELLPLILAEDSYYRRDEILEVLGRQEQLLDELEARSRSTRRRSGRGISQSGSVG